MKAKKFVIIGNNQLIGPDEVYTDWYQCTNCDEQDLASWYDFCPRCGVKIRWKKEVDR